MRVEHLQPPKVNLLNIVSGDDQMRLLQSGHQNKVLMTFKEPGDVTTGPGYLLPLSMQVYE
jgi:hypothetical protein